MDKYKNFVVIEEIKSLLRQGKNEEALERAEGLDPKRLKDNYDCMILGETFLKNGMLGKAKDCYALVYDRKKNRRVALELANICIRLKKADEAETYFEDYRKMAPNDYFNYIFKYRIDRLKGRPIKEQAESLEKLKSVEFTDNWGYELAKLYHKMQEVDKCLKVCDEVILWFGDGEYVDKAKALKAYYSGEISLKELNPARKPAVERNEGRKDTESAEAGTGNTETGTESTETGMENITEGLTDQSVQTPDTVDTYISENDAPAIQEPQVSDAVMEYAADSAEAGPEIPDSLGETPEAQETSFEDTATTGEAFAETAYSEKTAEHQPVREDYQTGEPVQDDIQNGYYRENSVQEPETFEAYNEVDYTEEEYTEEDLAEAEEDTIRVIPPENIMISGIKSVDKEIELSTDELARQIEAVLMEDSIAKEVKESMRDSGRKEDNTRDFTKEFTRVWGRDEAKPAKEKKSGRPLPAEETYDIPEEKDEKNSPLLDAVERELGFVSQEEKEPPQKKGWMARWKERHQEKERRKQEAREEEELKKKEAELEKQRFIEKERKKDKKKYLDQQRQMAKLAKEKALDTAAPVKEQKAPQKEAQKEVRKEEPSETYEKVTVAEREEGVYVPKKLKCVPVSEKSPLYDILKSSGKSLEDYFGFFACQKDVGEQIVKCLEQLVDKSAAWMNYCIIGQKGNGKKAIAHGFAKFVADCGLISSMQTVWTEASKVNEIDLTEKTDKLKGRCLVINQAGSLEVEAVEDIYKIIEKLKRNVMIVVTDYRKPLYELFKGREAFEELFKPRVSIPTFNQDDLFDYVDYKVGKAGFVFEEDAYDLMVKRITGIMRATDEGALARTEKYLVKTIDNAEQRNGEAYIKQTLERSRHVRSNVIIAQDLPSGI